MSFFTTAMRCPRVINLGWIGSGVGVKVGIGVGVDTGVSVEAEIIVGVKVIGTAVRISSVDVTVEGVIN